MLYVDIIVCVILIVFNIFRRKLNIFWRKLELAVPNFAS